MSTKGLRKDPAWKYAHQANPHDRNAFTCNFCGKISKGGVCRAKQHIVGGYRNVDACKNCPTHVKEEIKEYIAKKKQEKEQTKLVPNFDEAVFEDDDHGDEDVVEIGHDGKRVMTSSGSKSSNVTFQFKRKKPRHLSSGPEILFKHRKDGKMEQKTLNEELRDARCQQFTRWMYVAGIPCNGVSYPNFPILDSGQCGLEKKVEPETKSWASSSQNQFISQLGTKVKVVDPDHDESPGSHLSLSVISKFLKAQTSSPEPIIEVASPDTSETRTSHLPLTAISKFLKGIPQSPHFFQLRNYSELVKKNLISGWDRTFEEVVEQIHALKVDDFWIRVRELWKTLEELQSLGYNVLLLRRRLVELHDILVELKWCKGKIFGLKNEAEIHRREKSRLEKEIIKLQAWVGREHICIKEALREVKAMENDLPKFETVFDNLALKPL